MELLELYLTILVKIFNEVMILSQLRNPPAQRKLSVKIAQCGLMAFDECSNNYTILREFIFNSIFNFCKKSFENSLEIKNILFEF